MGSLSELKPFLREIVENCLSMAFEDAAEAAQKSSGFKRLNRFAAAQLVRDSAYVHLLNTATIYECDSETELSTEDVQTIVSCLRDIATHPMPPLTRKVQVIEPS